MAITSEEIRAEFEEQDLLGRISLTSVALRNHWDREGFHASPIADLWLDQIAEDTKRLMELRDNSELVEITILAMA